MDEKQEIRQEGINLMDFVFYCLEKWRWILVCMLAMAVIIGVYKYRVTVKQNQIGDTENLVIEESSGQPDGFYEQAITDLENDLEMQGAYLRDSVVMQMDPYHISTGMLSYYMECGEHMDSIIAAYFDFVLSGRLAEELYTADTSVSVEDLRHLISFTKSDDAGYKLEADQTIKFTGDRGSVFQVQIKMPDSDLCNVYLKYAEEIIAEYSSQIQMNVAEHELTLLASVQSEKMDSEIQEYQSSMRQEYKTSAKDLQTLQTEFNTIQSTQGNKNIPVTLKNPISTAVKFSILGLALGAGVSCLALWIFYMLGGRLHNIENFETWFGMPLLGIIRTSGTKKKLFGFIDTWIFQLGGGFYTKISFEEQIKMAAANVQASFARNFAEDGMKKIMIAGTVSEKEVASLYTQLMSEMKELSASSYMQIVFQSSALKELEDYDGIVFMENKRVSNAELIVQERRLALDRNVKVLGTIIMC